MCSTWPLIFMPLTTLIFMMLNSTRMKMCMAKISLGHQCLTTSHWRLVFKANILTISLHNLRLISFMLGNCLSIALPRGWHWPRLVLWLWRIFCPHQRLWRERFLWMHPCAKGKPWWCCWGEMSLGKPETSTLCFKDFTAITHVPFLSISS